MSKTAEHNLIEMFEAWSKERAINIEELPRSGSDRIYYRINGKKKKALGVYNPDLKENIAFISFSKHFFDKGLNVPEVYAKDLDSHVYLVQDLGDTTLFSYLTKLKQDNYFPDELMHMYKKILKELPQFQILSSKNIDYSVCYPRASFDKQSMMWDLSYFKYYFLKLAQIPFDEQRLEDDFQTFTNYLLQAGQEYFLYRDFQSRNIMIHNEVPYFIDYQGGRKGALQYDLASLLYDAKADIPNNIRVELLEHYVNIVSSIIPIKKQEFIEYYYGFVLIRIMQAMGAYGFRGFYEKKAHFLQSIPYAINNLNWILNNVELPIKVPTLIDVLHRLGKSKKLKKFDNQQSETSDLTVKITSFSYKKGIPVDTTNHGGGFVFDCRALHNPGKYEEYKQLTGMDKPVIDFLSKEEAVDGFLENIFAIIDSSVDKYIERSFDHLMINFGCTGGQHRSVYCAEKMAKHLKEKYSINIILHHTEQQKEAVVIS